jgi:hypothetical protein
MSPPNPTRTITQVFQEFLADQKARLSHKTFLKYWSILDLFRLYLENYGPYPDPDAYRRLTQAGGTFCGTFGPEHITPGFSEFLGYFMPRKVVAGNETMKAAGTVTKKLARWLVDKGYVDDADYAQEVAGRASRELPASQKLLNLLDACCAEHPPGPSTQRIEGHFWIKRVEPGNLWLESILGDAPDIGPIPVPPKAAQLSKKGWDIGGVVVKTARGWRLAEVWNVSP